MLSVQQLLDRKPKGIFSVKPDDPVITAIKKMAEHHIGALLVMNGDRLAGIVSERDYARKVVLLGRSSTETPVEAIMTARVITVTARTGLRDRRLRSRRLRRGRTGRFAASRRPALLRRCRFRPPRIQRDEREHRVRHLSLEQLDRDCERIMEAGPAVDCAGQLQGRIRLRLRRQ